MESTRNTSKQIQRRERDSSLSVCSLNGANKEPQSANFDKRFFPWIAARRTTPNKYQKNAESAHKTKVCHYFIGLIILIRASRW
jgi:hypothetical protein